MKDKLRRVTEQLESRERELAEATEQQTATSEILGVIASSPTDISGCWMRSRESAVRLARAKRGLIRQYDGKVMRLAANYGESPEKLLYSRDPSALVPRTGLDVRSLTENQSMIWMPSGSHPMWPSGARTALAVPLLREDTPIGVFTIRRDLVRPFTERQIKLVKTFADQAVIAIENVRLFQELKESLEQQTATSEILGVIASSPTDIQPVLDTVAKNAARVVSQRCTIISHAGWRSLSGL